MKFMWIFWSLLKEECRLGRLYENASSLIKRQKNFMICQDLLGKLRSL